MGKKALAFYSILVVFALVFIFITPVSNSQIAENPYDLTPELNGETTTETDNATTYDIPLYGSIGPGDWLLVSYVIDVAGSPEIVLDDSVFGGGGTTWDVVKWYDITDTADPWKTYRIGASTNDLNYIDNTMGFWIHFIGVDGTLTLGLKGEIPISTEIIIYAGWNLIGYPSLTPRLASEVFPPCVDKIEYYDPSEPFWPISPYLINDFYPGEVTLRDGLGYWVRSIADFVVIIDG